MKKLLILLALLLLALPGMAQDDADPCVLDPARIRHDRPPLWAGHSQLPSTSLPSWKNATKSTI